MSWLQLLLGLLTATLVYRWQKAVDRETSIQAEKRAAYAKYISACKQFYFSQPFRDRDYEPEELKAFYSFSTLEREAYVLRDQVYLLASDSVLSALVEQDKALRGWIMSFPEPEISDAAVIEKARIMSSRFIASHQRLIDAMRAELATHHQMSIPKPLIEKIANGRAAILSRFRVSKETLHPDHSKF